MIGVRFAGPRRLLVGRDDTGRFLPWVFALMVYVVALSGIGLVGLDRSLHATEDSLANTMTVAVPAEASDARLQTVLAFLRRSPGVGSVRQIDAKETARLLEPWLGASAKIDELPVPKLIDVRLDPGGGADLTAMRQQIVAIAPGARVENTRSWVDETRSETRPMQQIFMIVIAVALLLVALLTAFSTRIRLTIHRPVVELFRLLGAADSEIVRQFAAHSGGLVLFGGVIGAVAALLTLIALRAADHAAAAPTPLAAANLGDWRVWMVLAGAAAAAALVAIATARVIVLRQLARMP